jgi:hypothetical protein
MNTFLGELRSSSAISINDVLFATSTISIAEMTGDEDDLAIATQSFSLSFSDIKNVVREDNAWIVLDKYENRYSFCTVPRLAVHKQSSAYGEVNSTVLDKIKSIVKENNPACLFESCNNILVDIGELSEPEYSETLKAIKDTLMEDDAPIDLNNYTSDSFKFLELASI